MRKLFRITLVTFMLLSLFGCSQKEPSEVKKRTDTHTYKYRLEITGRMNGAAKDRTFVFLSNLEDITFGQAWKASGLSSNTADYFEEEEAKLVAVK